jgi:hypothetical protein
MKHTQMTAAMEIEIYQPRGDARKNINFMDLSIYISQRITG